jgi:hypothetical protein
MKRLRYLLMLIVLVMVLSPTLADAQQGYPGAGYFGYQCVNGGILFSYLTSSVLQVSFEQMLTPLNIAMMVRQNQPIAFSGEVGLWALQSNELQIHRNDDPEHSKVVFPSSICGVLPLMATPTNGSPGSNGLAGTGGIAQAIAYAQAVNGGQAIAFAGVSNGQAFAFAAVTGEGQAAAFAQSSGGNGGSGRTYVVQSGDNLFRIALRFGTTVETLATLNGITNTSLIYPGQVIYLP